jgi:hypothetical protein
LHVAVEVLNEFARFLRIPLAGLSLFRRNAPSEQVLVVFGRDCHRSAITYTLVGVA